MSFPVHFDAERPPVFQRAHVFLRVALLVVIGWIGHPLGLLWLGIPIVAAILVAQKSGQRYLDEDGPTVTKVLNWLLDLVAYLALLTDQLPGGGEHPVRLRIERSGSPTTGSAGSSTTWSGSSTFHRAIFSVVPRTSMATWCPGCEP